MVRLYNGKGTPYRWLDLEKLCGFLLPGNEIAAIKYFTAKVSARPHDPDQPMRQRLYLRALGTLSKVSVHFGHFLTHKVQVPMADEAPGEPPSYVRVLKTEEKGTDVNLATHMLHDAHMQRFDIAVVVSNDSDLLSPICIVREDLGKTVGMLNPHKNPSRALLPHLDLHKPICDGVLKASQFPDTLPVSPAGPDPTKTGSRVSQQSHPDSQGPTPSAHEPPRTRPVPGPPVIHRVQ